MEATVRELKNMGIKVLNVSDGRELPLKEMLLKLSEQIYPLELLKEF